jgi:CheY-like chemotaxis protein
MDEYRHNILCVDDELNVLNALKRLLRKEDFKIFTAPSGKEGLAVLEREAIHLVICDQRMPEMNGIEFLSQVRERYPDIVRISLTGYTEVDAITESINRGNIYKFFLKPWNDQQLKLEIRQALEYYDLSRDNRRLNAELREKNQALEGINANLEALVEERTEELAFRNRALEISHAVLDNLPIPVAGISTDRIIVLANLDAHKFFGDSAPFSVGTPVAQGLPQAVCDLIDAVFKTNQPGDCVLTLADAGTWRVKGMPLKDNRIGQGVIITTEAAAMGDGPSNP